MRERSHPLSPHPFCFEWLCVLLLEMEVVVVVVVVVIKMPPLQW